MNGITNSFFNLYKNNVEMAGLHRMNASQLLPIFFLGLCLTGCNLLSTAQPEAIAIATNTPVPVESQEPLLITCSISGDDLILYRGPGEFYEIYDSVAGNSEWHIVATAAGWFKIPVSDGYAWLPSNHIFTSMIGCDNLPQEVVSPPLTACVVTNNTNDYQAIRQSVSVDAQMIARFPPGASMPVLSKQGARYQVYIDGLNLSGFIEEHLVTTNGACNALDVSR